jgi:hypothetical protein
VDCKKLEQYHDCVTTFVLLLAVQKKAQKGMLCLEVLFNQEAEGIKILQLSQGSSTVCMFSFMM